MPARRENIEKRICPLSKLPCPGRPSTCPLVPTPSTRRADCAHCGNGHEHFAATIGAWAKLYYRPRAMSTAYRRPIASMSLVCGVIRSELIRELYVRKSRQVG